MHPSNLTDMTISSPLLAFWNMKARRERVVTKLLIWRGCSGQMRRMEGTLHPWLSTRTTESWKRDWWFDAGARRCIITVPILLYFQPELKKNYENLDSTAHYRKTFWVSLGWSVMARAVCMGLKINWTSKKQWFLTLFWLTNQAVLIYVLTII